MLDEQLTVNERPGWRIDDHTVFHDNIPYCPADTDHAPHTWRQIIDFFDTNTEYVFDLR
jgi:hypothetical protein